MLKTLIRRELLDNLRTFRFAAVLLITLLLVVANAVVLIQDYEQRLESYNNAVKMHYAREYREFVIDTDRADPESLHVVGIREGMSQKSVSPEAIPKFKDTLSLNRDFNTAATDLLLLVLFLAVLVSGMYLAFVRLEI